MLLHSLYNIVLKSVSIKKTDPCSERKQLCIQSQQHKTVLNTRQSIITSAQLSAISWNVISFLLLLSAGSVITSNDTWCIFSICRSCHAAYFFLSFGDWRNYTLKAQSLGISCFENSTSFPWLMCSCLTLLSHMEVNYCLIAIFITPSPSPLSPPSTFQNPQWLLAEFQHSAVRERHRSREQIHLDGVSATINGGGQIIHLFRAH